MFLIALRGFMQKNMLANNALPIEEVPCTNCFILDAVKKANLTIKPQRRGAYVMKMPNFLSFFNFHIIVP